MKQKILFFGFIFFCLPVINLLSISEEDKKSFFDEVLKSITITNIRPFFTGKSDEEKKELLFAKNANGDTALHIAVRRNFTQGINFLLNQAENIDQDTLKNVLFAQNRTRETSLHIAAEKGYVDIIDLLLKEAEKINKETLRELLKSKVLFAAVVNNQKESIEKILEFIRKFDENTRQEIFNVESMNGFTPLHIAQRRNYQEIITLLKNAGAKETSISKQSWLFAIKNKREQLIKHVLTILKNHKAKLEEVLSWQDENGDTALHHFTWGITVFPEDYNNIFKEIIEAIKLLEPFQQASIVNIKNNKGETPLYETVVTHEKYDIAKKLLEIGADANMANNGDDTLLHSLIIDPENDTIEMIKLLLRYKADPNKKNDQDETPLYAGIDRNNSAFDQRTAQIAKEFIKSGLVVDEQIIKKANEEGFNETKNVLQEALNNPYYSLYHSLINLANELKTLRNTWK